MLRRETLKMLTKMLVKVTGKGTPLVLVPGGLTGWLDWKTHAERLAITRKVLRVQLLNVQYGLEDRRLPQNYSVKTESRALAATLDELGLKAAIDMVAWSFGAMVALDYALDNQVRIRSLTLIEPPAYWVLRASGSLDVEARSTAIAFAENDDISKDQMEQFLYAVGLCPPGQSARELPQWSLLIRHRQSLRNTFSVLKHDDDLRRLHTFQRPVLLFKGTGSLKYLHQIIDMLAIQLPQARVIELHGGHALHIVSIDSFLKQIRTFQVNIHD